MVFDSPDYEDSFVPPREAERLFQGDRVAVTLTSKGEVLGLRVIEHRIKEVVGYYAPPSSGAPQGFVVWERKAAAEQIPIVRRAEGVGIPKAGEWLRVRLEFPPGGRFAFTAELVEIYGMTVPPSADIAIIVGEFGLDEHHSREAVAEAERFGAEIKKSDLEGRRDLRDVPFITIDGEDARDFDDAIFVERLTGREDSAAYALWVAIADVSHYVKEGTSLDRDAYARATSVYFPERAFHMLPRALSENLCSLRPDVERLTMACRMEFDLKGKRGKTEVFNAVIRSRRRATYNEIQAERDQHPKGSTWEFEPHFELYEILKEARTRRGSIDFELPEVKVLAQPTGEVIKIENRERKDAHRLIEEFMIAANEAVTVWATRRNWPFVFRVHEEPKPEALQKFADLAAGVGVTFDPQHANSPMVIADVVRKLHGHPAQQMLNSALLRSMKQAIYSAEPKGHFGLASSNYTHFTSPIRRYPDLLVHRLLKQILKSQAVDKSELQQDLEKHCEHCSYRERLASDAEREAIKLKQVRLMEAHLGEDFEAQVSGMTENGLYTQILEPFVEGFVPKESLGDDQFEFNESRMIFSGRRNKRMFKIGDKISVQVVRADRIRRQIELKLN